MNNAGGYGFPEWNDANDGLVFNADNVFGSLDSASNTSDMTIMFAVSGFSGSAG